MEGVACTPSMPYLGGLFLKGFDGLVKGLQKFFFFVPGPFCNLSALGVG